MPSVFRDYPSYFQDTTQRRKTNNSNKSVKVDSIIKPSSDDSLIPSTSSLNDVILEQHIGSDDEKYKRLLKKYANLRKRFNRLRSKFCSLQVLQKRNNSLKKAISKKSLAVRRLRERNNRLSLKVSKFNNIISEMKRNNI